MRSLSTIGRIFDLPSVARNDLPQNKKEEKGNKKGGRKKGRKITRLKLRR